MELPQGGTKIYSEYPLYLGLCVKRESPGCSQFRPLLKHVLFYTKADSGILTC